MNPIPLVSIVIPAFNPRFFAKALNSALVQAYGNLEIIVCDDSRGDEIEKVVRSLEEQAGITIRYVSNPQTLGVVENLKAGLGLAQGEYIKFLCDDDQLFPGCIEQQAQQLTEHADVNLVLVQRLYWDADDLQLPSRLENSPLSPVSGVFKGEDLLGICESFPANFFGGLSCALFRRLDLLELLPALTQPGHCFVASLDFALYVCLLRRGNLAVLNGVLSVERLYPERWSRQQTQLDAAEVERQWLMQMLKARSGEPAPAPGWIRYVQLAKADTLPRDWEELPLSRTLGTKQTTQNWRVGIASESFAQLYGEWLACRVLSEAQRKLLPDNLAGWSSRPKIVPVVLDEQGSSAALGITLQSLEAQLYAPELTLVLSSACTEPALDGRVFRLPLQDDWQQQVNELLPQLDGVEWFYLLRAGDRLVESALLIMAERISILPNARCFYSDEGGLREGESVEPVFKPDFNLDLLRGYPYVGRTLAFQREAFLALGGFDALHGELAPHDVIWRLVEEEGTRAVEHVAEVLLESAFALSNWLSLPELVGLNRQVVRAHLDRMGIAHEIQSGGASLINRVNYVHEGRPLVSIIIVSKDHCAALQRCVESLLEKTAYSEYELLLVDNGSESAEAKAWFGAMVQLGSDRVRVLEYPRQGNAAAVRNFAAQQAVGQYLLMLNPFAVITNGQWLDEMLQQARRPEVGVVGAKLFSPDGRVLHAGLILGLRGPAGLPFYGELMHASGYMYRLQVVHDLSAVGSDCLMVRKDVFEAVGGLDEAHFAQTLNDVDLCLRVAREHYLVVWTPYAQVALGALPTVTLEEDEQASRVQEQETFYQRWLPVVARDPAYNPNLTLDGLGGSSFSLEPGLRSGWTPFAGRHLPVIMGLPVNASAIGHYRVTQPLIELEAAGRAVGRTYYNLPSIIEVERQSPDVIVLQGRYAEQPINEIHGLKAYSNARRIYELDDYVINVPRKNGHIRNLPGSADMENLVRRGISLCDRVVVSTPSLADALSSMHHDIRVVPNMLATHMWQGLVSRRRTSAKPRVGWGGGTSHAGDLAIIADVVRELASEVDWVFFGMCPEELRPYMHEFHGVIDLGIYPAKLASLNLDLALAPLEFHIFNDCKSNLRLLEYGACGYPVICTDTRAYDGYLPCTRIKTNTTDEWLQAIRMHLSDPDASYRMGDELRETVLRDYMLRGDNLRYWENGWLAD
ncbi:glycosyltransferase [Pseudomonas gingeri]|uniref:Glycosyltransferase n=2 Tax=Pseudomonas gingeri TaxID=117681 RepID=A0A7Y7YFA9_9PSED|nr:glycosyltransferase [Pseudomonas gingeri]NWC35262.1 glycosyltransferase [Pseudomonas gingeri]NWE30227.1 glycosyltransferase [Pseudomonas gingeri]NWE96574.1 glycosyltransferase [Pseudomonas gingeri]